MMQAIFAPRRFLACLVFAPFMVLFGHGIAFAQAEAGEGARVEIQAVRFGQARAPGGGDAWTEALVELAVVPNTDGGIYARWADRVRVALSLGVRTRAGDYAFYRASAEAVALESGRAMFRFYLPPEITRREQLATAEPYAWMVEVAVDGKPLPASPRAVSGVLNTPEAVRSFKDRVARSSTSNDGVLVPQYESPFANAYAGETPTFVRR